MRILNILEPLKFIFLSFLILFFVKFIGDSGGKWVRASIILTFILFTVLIVTSL